MPLSTCWTTSSGRPDFWPSSADAGAQFLVQGDERRIVGADRRHVVERTDDGHQVAVLLGHVHRHGAALAVQQQLHAGHAALQLTDAGDGADRVEPVGSHSLDVLTLGHGKDELVGRGERRLDRLDGHRTSRPDRGSDTREKHNIPQGKHGNGQSVGGHEGSPRTTHLGSPTGVPAAGW